MFLFFYLLSFVFVGVGAICPSEPHARNHLAVVPNKYYYELVNGSLKGVYSNPYRPGEAEAILLGNTSLPRASKRFVSWTFGGSQRQTNTTATIATTSTGNVTSGAMGNTSMAGRGPAWVRRGGMHGSMPRPSHTLPSPKPYKPFMGLWAKGMNVTAVDVEVEEEGEGDGWEPPQLSVVPAVVSKPNPVVVLGGLWLAVAKGGVSRGGSSAPLLTISPEQLRGAAKAVMTTCRGMVRAIVGARRAIGGFKGQPLKRLLAIRGGAAAAGYYGSALTWGIGAAVMAAMAYEGAKLYHEHWGAGQATLALTIPSLQPIVPSLASIANSMDHGIVANATCTPRPARATPRPAKADNGRWLWKEGSMFQKAEQVVQWRAPLLHTAAFTTLPTTGLPLPLSLPFSSLLSRAKQAFIKASVFNARALVLVDSPPVTCHVARDIERPTPSVILPLVIVPRKADAPSLRAFLAYFIDFFLCFIVFALLVCCLEVCGQYVLRAFARLSPFKVCGPCTCLTKEKADTYLA